MSSVLEPLALVVLVVLGVALCLPQLWKLWQSRTAAGVSLVGMVNGSVSYVCWVAWSLHEGLVGGAVAGAVPGVIWIATTLLALRCATREKLPGPGWQALVLPGVLGVVVLAGTLSIGGWVLLGYALSVSVITSVGPAAWEAWRAPSLAGLSRATWVMFLVEAVAWGGYGLLGEVRAYQIYGVLGSIGCLGVLAACLREERGWARPVRTP